MATEQFEQERDAGLNMDRSNYLLEIKRALERIDNGTYGISEKSGKPIPVERLEAEPRVDEQYTKGLSIFQTVLSFICFQLIHEIK